ncbi:MAG: hypothetical protein JO041_00580 [Acidobacteria bacterium]|nr:hypothetical protein [Acidobacteriota bacterium]
MRITWLLALAFMAIEPAHSYGLAASKFPLSGPGEGNGNCSRPGESSGLPECAAADGVLVITVTARPKPKPRSGAARVPANTNTAMTNTGAATAPALPQSDDGAGQAQATTGAVPAVKGGAVHAKQAEAAPDAGQQQAPTPAGQASQGPPAGASAPTLNVQMRFLVKHVTQDAIYVSGGRGAGLKTGMKLVIRDDTGQAGAPPVAECEVSAVADSSAVCDVKSASRELKAGDIAYLSEQDAENLAQLRATGGARSYPQVVTFSEGDPLDEEAREEVPRPPLPEVNRFRGRVGFDYGGIRSGGSAASSAYQMGGVVRADITRIGGTYWNVSGYWRGRLNNSSFTGQPTIQDLVNRTYHLSMTYDNPGSNWVAGFGRLYLPWANSLNTIDGGYVGRKLGHNVTAGVFGGSTPDPTSWNYNPNQRIAGSFINFQGGSYDNVRYTSTSGFGVETLGWVLNRPFVFFENGIYFKRYVSIYQSAQADDPRPAPGVAKPGPGLSRSYVTVRFQPHQRISFDLNHNYFRDVPTFATQLIGTGLLDTSLFQGFSAGTRVEVVRHVAVYADLGRSSRTGDAKASLNQLYGVSVDRIWKTGLRADLRASKFDSSFGSGTYRSVSLSRTLGEWMHWQVQAGDQTLVSSFTNQGASKFINSSVDATLGAHYFMQVDFTTQRGAAFDYDQWMMTFGYRFDNHAHMGGTK